MVLLLDNYDSFTYNLYQLTAALGPEVMVAPNDKVTLQSIEQLAPSHIIISPGPGRPSDSGISRAVIQHFYRNTPLLGVCLGHQCLGEVFGSQIVAAPRIIHGKPDQIEHDGSQLFKGLPPAFQAARYHSLVVASVPANFKKTAWSQDGSLMAMEHDTLPVFGVQFHPESFMTEHGRQLMENFLAC